MNRVPASAGRLVDGALEASVAGSFTRVGIRVRRRVLPWTELAEGSMSGRTVLVTGATSGLGLAAATEFARLGARTILLGRDPARTLRAADQVRAASVGGQVSTVVADLADLGAVRAAAEQVFADVDRLDVLVHNAGALTQQRTTTGDGLELTYQTHVVAPFLLTHLLHPLLQPSGRVITVSSGGMYTQRLHLPTLLGQRQSYDGVVAYAQAKRAQVLLNQQWAKRSPVRFHAMHPGWADTPGVAESLPRFHRVLGRLLRSPAEGADTIVWLAAADEPADSSGGFWLDRRPRSIVRMPRTDTSPEGQRELWEQVAADAGVPVSTPTED